MYEKLISLVDSVSGKMRNCYEKTVTEIREHGTEVFFS
jgi:hypothetical protein